MNKQYLVVWEDQPATEVPPAVVSAVDANQATDKYLRLVYSKDEVFRESVLDRSINMSFAERFFIVTDEERQKFDRTGAVDYDLDVVEARVRVYFGARPDIAEKYVQYIRTGKQDLIDDEAFEVIASSDPEGVAALALDELQHL
ncbi:hypothetical protein [Massilia horti]|uniref:Uncharacterized protein n=1 Tax=Massilia horti TaxID=2562153 RepID=A0A4Y9T1V4_9BURK|nr:hypothetical protein [Massilia horti]TFW33588.1 hypothetical protein E4O92_06225 [Massilia horti]